MRRAGIKHLRDCLPHEGCGLILTSGRFVPCENMAAEHPSAQVQTPAGQTARQVSFVIDHKIYLKHSREIAAIVHSHVSDDDDAPPSASDHLYRRATGVPWIIHVFKTDGTLVTSHEI